MRDYLIYDSDTIRIGLTTSNQIANNTNYLKISLFFINNSKSNISELSVKYVGNFSNIII
jgi:hypothetical protein